MKRLLIYLLFAFFCFNTFAQAPKGFNYQGIARDNNGKELITKTIGLRLNVLLNSATGTVIYTETHNTSTNSFGLFNVRIGSGTVTAGNFNGINWSAGQYFLKIEMDPNGSTAYAFMGTSQLVSVPYALMANKALKSLNDLDTNSTNELQILKLTKDTLYLDRGGFVYLGNYDDNNAILSLKSKLKNDSTYFKGIINNKQDKLIAGSGIAINSANVISATDTCNPNKIQLLGLSQDTLSISKGNSLVLPRFIPKSTCILSTDITPPSGYAYSDDYITTASSNAWQAKANMGTARLDCVGATVNNKIYVFGGSNGTTFYNTVEEYDPSTNSWSTKSNMPTARSSMTCEVVANKIYVIGGVTNASTSTNIIEEYNPLTDSWSSKATMPTSRGELSSAVVNNKIYVFGGWNSSLGNLYTTEEYDPAVNSWTTKANMNSARRTQKSVAVNGKIYVMGGYSTIHLSINEEFNPASNTWASKASMPTARSDAHIAALNNKIYNIAGYNGSYTALNEVYDPALNTWTTKASLPVAQSSGACVVCNNKIFIIGGAVSSTSVFNTNYMYNPESLYYIHCKQ